MNIFNKTLSRVTLALGVTFMSAFQLCADDWKEVMYVDPTIFVENGKYYLTGTRNQEPQGFAILESIDLKHWTVPDGTPLQLILRKGDQTYGEKGFWTPQYFKGKRTYYFIYIANEQTVIASSKSVFDPFRQKEVKPIDASAKNISSSLFRDDDGEYYLYRVRFNKGNYLWVTEFDIKEGSIKPETLKQYVDCTEPWGKIPNYKSAPVVERPTATRWDGVYYLFYSANHFMNIGYSVGHATASSPFGPWKKYPNSPIIHRSLVGENGSGYGDVFKGLDGKYYYVYHVHRSNSTVSPRKTRIVPLILGKGNDGVYNITVDREYVIKPMWK